MAALEGIQLRLYWRIARRPEFAVLVDVEEPPALLVRYAVVAVARQAPQPCVPVEAVAATHVRNQAEEALRAQIVDPGIRRPGRRDYVFPGRVIKMTESHASSSRAQRPCSSRNDVTQARGE